MKLRHGIGCVLLMLGMLLCLGAVGQLDYLTAQAVIESSDEGSAIIKSLIGIVLVGAAACLNHDMVYKDE